MKTIETTGKIDKKGLLRLNKPLRAKNKDVKVIILLQEENEMEEENRWLSTISNNPAFYIYPFQFPRFAMIYIPYTFHRIVF